MTEQKPNIILFFSDQHRHDVMGCAGNQVIQTPNLDRMAEEGVRFSRTYCQSPLCRPARASLITGRYIHQHGVSSNASKNCDPEWPTFMKNLQDAGYTTAQVGKTHFHSSRLDNIVETDETKVEVDLREHTDFIRSFGLDYVLEEFDRYVHASPGVNHITHYTEYLKAKGLLEPYRKQVRSVWRATPHHWDGVTSVLPQEDDLTCYLADRSIDWLKSYKDNKPFFLMLSFVQPHVPLMADPVWAAYYENAEIPFGPRKPPDSPNEIWGKCLKALFKHSNSHLLTDDYLTNGARQYYGMVSLIDQRIGDIIKTVEALDLGDNTWFIYLADHGEMLGDHNLMAKTNFYKSSVLVPAIVCPPGRMEAKVVDSIIESIDITSTILDIAGAKPLKNSEAKSLLPLIEGDGSGREVAFSAVEGRVGKNDYYLVMAATERYRLTIERNTGVACELFDLLKDPDELNNLVNDPAYKDLCDEMKKKYIEPHLKV